MTTINTADLINQIGTFPVLLLSWWGNKYCKRVIKRAAVLQTPLGLFQVHVCYLIVYKRKIVRYVLVEGANSRGNKYLFYTCILLRKSPYTSKCSAQMWTETRRFPRHRQMHDAIDISWITHRFIFQLIAPHRIPNTLLQSLLARCVGWNVMN